MATMTRLVRGGLTAVACATVLAIVAAPASAGEPILHPATYPDLTTYSCRTDAIAIHPGQNINDFGLTKTCPHAEKVSGPGSADIFNAGSDAEGFITRFKPSMVEIKPSGKLVTPAVWDLHLHHVVWLVHGNPTFASGEEKTIATMPQGYGGKVGATENWGINEMIHNLGASENREVYMTWEIDWVPETTPARTDIVATNTRWLDVAGAPRVYPVFDAEKGFDQNGDGKFVFPDEVPTDPAAPRLRGAVEDQQRPPVDGPEPGGRDARLRRRPPPSRRREREPDGRPRRPRRRHAPPATTRPRSRTCSDPTPSTTSPPARSAGTSR